MEKTEVDLAIQKLHESTLQPEWMREMGAHYRRTGTFRPEDLRRVLGDPTKGVMISSEKTLESFLSQ
jgi:hypothetical protein